MVIVGVVVGVSVDVVIVGVSVGGVLGVTNHVQKRGKQK